MDNVFKVIENNVEKEYQIVSLCKNNFIEYKTCTDKILNILRVKPLDMSSIY